MANENAKKILGDPVKQSTIFELSKRYVEHIYNINGNQAEEAFSLKITKSQIEALLQKMTHEDDTLVAIHGLESGNNRHTFTLLILDENEQHRPISSTHAGYERWQPRKKIVEVVKGVLQEKACGEIKEHFRLMGFDPREMSCPKPDGN